MSTAEADTPVNGTSTVVIRAAATDALSADGMNSVSCRLQSAPQIDASTEGWLIALELALPAVVIPGS